MICENCKGTGKGGLGGNCLICKGTGKVCDVCGEQCEEGADVCLSDDCQEVFAKGEL